VNLKGLRFVLKLAGNVRTLWLGLLCGGVCSVCFGQAPPNDDFTNAIPLYGNSVTFTGTLDNATLEPGESECPCNHCFSGGSLWWSWTATNSTTVLLMPVEQHGASDAGFVVHTGTNVSTLADLDCNVLDTRTNRYACFAATEGTTYSIEVRGAGGSFTLQLATANSPAILTSPQDQTVTESASAFFSVFAAGLRPLSYQWRFEGDNLPGQTAPCLELHYLTTSQTGGYSVIVSNVSGVITSAVASLTISPTRPPVVLGVMTPQITNRFTFSIAGETGRLFRVWASTNLINWSDEESLRPYPYLYGLALVQNTNETSLYSIPMVSTQEFLRVSRHMDKEICVAHLKEIDFAIKLWTIEERKSLWNSVVESDITPYLAGGGLVCPSGGTCFCDSYAVTTAGVQPLCQKVPAAHYLPY
jgi:hypothetical protein